MTTFGFDALAGLISRPLFGGGGGAESSSSSLSLARFFSFPIVALEATLVTLPLAEALALVALYRRRSRFGSDASFFRRRSGHNIGLVLCGDGGGGRRPRARFSGRATGSLGGDLGFSGGWPTGYFLRRLSLRCHRGHLCSFLWVLPKNPARRPVLP